MNSPGSSPFTISQLGLKQQSGSSGGSNAPFYASPLYSEPAPIYTPHLTPLSYRLSLSRPPKEPTSSSESHSEGSEDDHPPVKVELPPTSIQLPQTPGILPATPGPSQPPISPAIPPWRVRWACFSLASDSQVAIPSGNLGNSNVHASSSSTGGTPARAGETAANNDRASGATPTQHQASRHSISSQSAPIGRLKEKARTRSDSNVSTSSKKQRFTAYPTHKDQNQLIDPDQPISRLLSGIKSRASAAASASTTSVTDPFKEAKNVYLHAGSPIEDDTAAADLPLRMAHIEVDGGPDLAAGIARRLWLFSILADQRDSALDAFGSYAGLEMTSSGSFSCQDLFPSLYNDNSIYTAPSSRPARLYASSLQLATNVNGEAVKASETFLLTVRQRLLNQSLEKCRPEVAAKGVLCGDGLVWPSTSERISSPCAKSAVYLSYDLHFDYLGIVATAFLHPVTLAPVSVPGPPTKRRKLLPGDSIVLCPIGLPATFVRWYGVESQEQPSAKTASREKATIESLRQAFTEGLEDEAGDVAAEDIWCLARTGEIEVVWPASFALAQTDLNDKALVAIDPENRETKAAPVILPTSRDLVPRNKRIDYLTDLTSAYIEQQGKERERERKEKAERQLASQQNKQMALEVPATVVQHTLTTTPASMDQGQQVQGGALLMNVDRPLVHQSASTADNRKASAKTRGLRRSGVHTLASLAARLPPPRKPRSTASKSATAEATTQDSLDSQMDTNGTDRLYSAPLSMATSVSREATVPASAPPALSAFSATQESRYTDFSWDSHGNDSHAPFGLSNIFADNSFMFEDDGNNMFADNGLTEDDFSFFDTPAVPVLPPLAEAAAVPNLTDTQSLVPLDYHNANAPIDHFGHLMPTSDSPASAAMLGTSPLFLDNPTPSTVSSTTKPSSTTTFAMESPFTSVFSASPLFLTDYPVPKASQSGVSEPTGGGPLPNPLQEATVTPPQLVSKYAITPVGFDDHMGASIVSPHRDRAFGPIRFADDSMCAAIYAEMSLSPHSRKVPLARELVQTHCDAKARALRARFIGRPPKLDNAQLRRRWIPSDSARPHLVYDSTSDSDLSEVDTPSQTHRMHSSSRPISQHGSSEVYPIYISAELLHAKTLVAQLVPLQTDPISSVAKAHEGGRATKGEKEAVATVFLQQVVENPHFRRRLGIIKACGDGSKPDTARTHIALDEHTPALTIDTIPATSIGIVCHSAVMKMSALALNFWNKIGIKPYNGPKDVKVIVLAASSISTDEVQSAIQPWLQDLSIAYQAANLGNLSYASQTAEASGPLYTLNSGSSTLSEIASLQEKLHSISSRISQDFGTAAYAAAYILVTDEECLNPSSTLIYACLRICLLRKGLVPQILPLSVLAERLSSGWETSASQRSLASRLAMTLYNRLSICVERFTAKRLETLPATMMPSGPTSRLFPAPAFKIITGRKQICTFATHWPPPTLDITHRHRILHVGYAYTSDHKWLLLSAIDDEGEYSSVRVRNIDGLEPKFRIRRVWHFAKEIAESLNVEWRLCIAKAGHMPLEELQTWTESLTGLVAAVKRPMHVTIGCIGESLPVAPAASMAAESEGHQEGIFSSDTSIKATYSDQPTAIYDQFETTVSGLPRSRKRTCYALVSSWLHYIPKHIEAAPASASQSYSYHILFACAHPMSSNSQMLSAYLRDVTKSYMDLRTLGQQRWELGDEQAPDSCLPWHLAVTRLLREFEFESLFQ